MHETLRWKAAVRDQLAQAPLRGARLTARGPTCGFRRGSEARGLRGPLAASGRLARRGRWGLASAPRRRIPRRGRGAAGGSRTRCWRRGGGEEGKRHGRERGCDAAALLCAQVYGAAPSFVLPEGHGFYAEQVPRACPPSAALSP